MTRSRAACAVVGLHLCSLACLAQMPAPTVRGVKPLGVGAGEVAEVEIRGADLEGASGLLFDDLSPVVSAIDATKDRVKARVRVPRGAAPGLRTFRVVTPKGISNAATFAVGRPIPTAIDGGKNHGFRSAQEVVAPSTIAGELKNGDETDVYAVTMKAGQTLVAEAYSARGGSGMDALVTIFSPEGRELAADDDLFGKDAAAWAYIPASGRYYVQVQDANGRNPNGEIEKNSARDYLLTVGDVPLVVSAFPPGGRRGGEARIALLGVNLPEGLDFRFAPPISEPLGDFPLHVTAPKGEANAPTVRLGDGPETTEADPEPADDPMRPTPAVVPGAINGRFSAKDDGDLDYYKLVPADGKSRRYAISALAARVGSAADPVLSALDAKGASAAEDDDSLGRDARIERTIDPSGLVIAVRDHFGRGGPRFVYRVEVEPIAARRLTITADLGGRSLPRGGAIALPIALDRRDEDGPATILAGELPPGVTAAPVTIPAGGKTGVLILSASPDAPLGPFRFRLVARDVRGSVEASYRERGRRRGPPRMGQDGKPEASEGPVPVDRPMLAVVEPSSLGVTISASEISVKPGESADVRVALDRRGSAAKSAVTLRLLGGLEDFEKVDDVTVPADRAEHVFKLKAKPGASARRVMVSAKGWFEGGSEAQGVDARGATLIVP